MSRTAISPKVVDIETLVTPFTSGTWLDEHRVTTPLSPFERFSERRSSWRGPGADLVHVLIKTEDADIFGVGQTRGGSVVERLILDHLRPLLQGQDPREIRVLYEQITRATNPYAAGGVAAMAVSGVDLASWDLLARSLGTPLYRVLGGTSEPIPYYLTSAAASVTPMGDVFASAQNAPRLLKIAMPYGPADGIDGLQENLNALDVARSAVGPRTPLAVDCFMSWDLAYTVDFARRAADLGLAWIEEPLPPHAVDELATLRRLISPVRVAAGEHLFEPSTVYAYLERGAVDVLQIDVTWCGGLHAALAIGFAAVSRGVTFAPHSSGMQPWAVHLLSTFGPLGLAEVLADVTPRLDPATPPTPSDGPGVGLDPRELGFSL
jgi:L-rhamnonate dehydratase